METASPLLVVGMHRSGTRLVADVLASLGVFMGADRQGDSESITFIRMNEAIFHECGTLWSEPLPVHIALSDPALVERIAANVRGTLSNALSAYLGRTDVAASSHFGWKDPRNTFTLPIWKRIFPRLRMIHVLRHGVDVAASLAQRQRQMCTAATGAAVPSPLAVFREHSLGVLSTRRGWTIHEAFGLWEQYVEKARLEAAALAAGCALEVRFEELLENPAKGIVSLARFCGVDPAPASSWRERIEPARAFAFRHHPETATFAASVADILAVYGYQP